MCVPEHSHCGSTFHINSSGSGVLTCRSRRHRQQKVETDHPAAGRFTGTRLRRRKLTLEGRAWHQTTTLCTETWSYQHNSCETELVQHDRIISVSICVMPQRIQSPSHTVVTILPCPALRAALSAGLSDQVGFKVGP